MVDVSDAPNLRRWALGLALLGAALWIPYGIFEMLQPFGIDAEYRDDPGYEVVTDGAVYRLYNVPGALALMLTTLSVLLCLSILASLTRAPMRAERILTFVALALAVVSLLGAVAGFDPLFTGPRLLGTTVLGGVLLLAGWRATRGVAAAPAGAGFMLLGLLGLFLFPLWPLVYAVGVIPHWLGAVLIGAFGVGWAWLCFQLTGRSTTAAVVR